MYAEEYTYTGDSVRNEGIVAATCTAKLILYTKGVKVRQDIIVFST